MVLEGENYNRRHELMKELQKQTIMQRETTVSTVAAGISEFQKGTDHTVLEVFTRADNAMYQEKAAMKD